jgi:hypothetical protein
MSNKVFTEFCVRVPEVNQREEQWVRSLVTRWTDQETPPEPWWDELSSTGAPPTFEVIYRDRLNGQRQPVVDILFMSDEIGNPDEVAILLQHFLAEFRPTSYAGFEVSYTCNHLDPSCFGGTAFFVTAAGYEMISTQTWLHDQISQFVDRAGGKAGPPTAQT